MEREDIEALRASVDVLRDSHEQLVEEVRGRTTAARRGSGPPPGPRHIDEVLEREGEVAGPGFVIPAS